MDPATINTTTFTLKRGLVDVAGAVTYNGLTGVFTPTANLLPNTLYTATVSIGAKDLAGNSPLVDHVWTFTTGALADTTDPTVTLTVPANGAIGVQTNTSLTATFSEAMDPSTLNTTTYLLRRGLIDVAGAVTYNGLTGVFTPTANLLPNTLYTATITTDAEDLAGNGLTINHVWSFTTGAAPDTIRPTVTLTVPLNNAVGVQTNTSVTATFSEAMDPSSINTNTFTLKRGLVDVVGAVTYNGLTAVFTPNANLLGSTLYTATVTTGVKDLAGNFKNADFVWTFTTGVAPDTTRPTVTLTVPNDGQVNVQTNTSLTATFSEAMDPATLTTTTYTLKRGITPVVGTVNNIGLTSVFTPTANLLGTTLYTATITTGAEDLAGNSILIDHVWTFTTGVAPDILPPTITLLNPADGTANVCINKVIAATFSEDMDPTTITTANFLITGVVGVVAYDALTRIATFTPNVDLTAGNLFNASITTGAKDLAGNSMAVSRLWTFTTGNTTCAEPVVLGDVAPFGGVGGGAGMTNMGTLTVINGDIGTTGVSTTVTGFHDTTGDIYSETPLNVGTVNGRIYTDAPPPGGAGTGGNAQTMVIATAAVAAAQTAFNNMSPAALPGGIDPGAGQLGGLTLAPGIYKSAGADFILTGADLVLDGQGDPKAVWVFQTAGNLTIGAPAGPRLITLINGAKAANVFWRVGAAARIENGSTAVGTIIASAGVTMSTAGQVQLTRLNGRAIGLNASVTVVNTVITIPTP